LLLVLATTVSRWLELKTLHWLLRYAQFALVIGLPIVFQPELRRALEQVGRNRLFVKPLASLPEQDAQRVIDAVVEAVVRLAHHRTGAIIVIERQTGLGDIAETGIAIDAVVSTELLINLFVPHTPLHDGAVILRGDRIVAAACFLPLTDNRDLDVQLGSRHRAAIGISEHSDALAVVVSEETGTISVAQNGKLIRQLDDAKLRDLLTRLLIPAEGAGAFAFLRQRNVSG
ncbi:MAG TPA: diadenylate cyclase CdaA, partial [Bacillota bacterium]